MGLCVPQLVSLVECQYPTFDHFLVTDSCSHVPNLSQSEEINIYTNIGVCLRLCMQPRGREGVRDSNNKYCSSFPGDLLNTSCEYQTSGRCTNDLFHYVQRHPKYLDKATIAVIRGRFSINRNPSLRNRIHFTFSFTKVVGAKDGAVVL